MKSETQTMIIALSVVIAIVIIYMVATRKEFMTIKASDGRVYNVMGGYDNTEGAAESFAKMNKVLLEFLDYLKNKYKINHVDYTTNNEEENAQIRGIVERVLVNYNFEKLFETAPTGADGTSYTVDKGEELYMCARDKKTLTLHDTHDMMFVVLHELAHMGNLTWGHGTDFWEVFKFILYEADQSGLHPAVDYANNPMVYCGLTIDYNPLFDSECRSIWL